MHAHALHATNPRKLQASRKRDRRQRLLAEAIHRHGVPGLAALLDLIELEAGEALGIDRRLEALIDATQAAIALTRGRR